MNQVEIHRMKYKMLSTILLILNALYFTHKLGEIGGSIFVVSIVFLSLIYMLINDSLYEGLGNFVRSNLQKKQIANAKKVFKAGRGLACIILIFTIAIFLVFHYFVKDLLFSTNLYFVPIYYFLPIVLIEVISGYLLTYLRYSKFNFIERIVFLLRPILIFVISNIFVYRKQIYGKKVAQLSLVDAMESVYGVAGLFEAIIACELIILILLLILFVFYFNKFRITNESSSLKKTDSLNGIYYNLGINTVNYYLYFLFLLFPWLFSVFVLKNNYTYIYSYLVVFLSLILMATLLSNYDMNLVLSKALVNYKKNDFRASANYLMVGNHIIFTRAIFITVFVAVFSSQIAFLFSNSSEGELSSLIGRGALVICFMSWNFFVGKYLFRINNKLLTFAAYIASTVFSVLLYGFFVARGVSVLVSLELALLFMSIILFLMFFIIFTFILRINIIRLNNCLFPIISACIGGLVCMLIRKVMYPHLGFWITSILSLCVFYAIFWGVLLYLRDFREKELSLMSDGKLLKLFGSILGVF